MLLIIGEGKDLSTSIVMDWLLYYDCPFMFLHEKSIIEKVQTKLSKGVEETSLQINN